MRYKSNGLGRKALSIFLAFTVASLTFIIADIRMSLPVQASSTVGGSISRTEVLTRAEWWVNTYGVIYSQNQNDQKPDPDGHPYRPDCSGFISMAWHLPKKSDGWDRNTGDLDAFGDTTYLSNLGELLPGDAILGKSYGHVALFDRWANPSRTEMWIYDEYKSGREGRHIIQSRSWYESEGFRGLRYNKITSMMPDAPDAVSRDGVVVSSSGRISVYAVRADGDVWGRSQESPGGSFNAWQRLSTGGGFAGQVAVLRDDRDRVALYARRSGTIFGASQQEVGGSFGVWGPIGTNGAGVTGDPRAVYASEGRIAIYATTSSGNVSGVTQTQAGGGFGSWQQLTSGGGYMGKPAAVVDSQQRVALYVRRNGMVYGASQSQANGSFGTWAARGVDGAGVASDPVAVYGVGGRIAIYVTSTAGNVAGVNQVAAGGEFGAWQVLTSTGGYEGRPAVLVDEQGRVAVYVRRSGAIYGASQPEAGGPFGAWAARGTGSPQLIGDPTAVYGVGDRIALYAAATNDSIGGVSQGEAGGTFGNWIVL
uniref:PLL-like beta propeller domain-containing protein n=1 Tax=Salinispora arenicola (strain CNS-205) TaxID=391037 RepID=A8M891_SALAI